MRIVDLYTSIHHYSLLGGMGHDERYFEKPEVFNPDRFVKHPFGIKEDCVDDPARRPNLQFGGGRRVCPGIAFAKTSMVCVPYSAANRHVLNFLRN